VTIPALFGKGRFGLAATVTIPALFGKGRFGLAATVTIPALFGKGRFGLAATVTIPVLFGKGRLGLLLDTNALARQGTASTAVRARTENDFMAGGLPRGMVLVAYRLRNTNVSGGCQALLQLWWNLTL
jgi:hypothetical protein